MNIYSIPFCPFCYRVKIAIHEKNILESLVKIQEIDLKNPPKEFLEINPNKTVPTLQINGNNGFAESMIIVEYLNNLSTDTVNLFGKNQEEIAKNKVLIDRISQTIIPTLIGCFYANGNVIKFKKSIQKIPEIFHKLELLLTKTDTPFFGGTSFNAVDISLVPFLCLYLMANEFNKELILPKKESKLYLYIKNIQDHKFLNELIFSDNKLKTDIKEELLFESEETITIKSSSRNLIENIESEVQSMNKRISLKSKRNSPILWTKGNNEKGPFIETSILFKNAEEAFSALQTICELQESSDHHAHFVLENFSQIKVEVCTHQPKWGVTAMDIAFAETLSNRI